MITRIYIPVLIVLSAKQTFGSVCDEITWVSRPEWGARNSTKPAVNMTLPIDHVFIHHTAAPDQCHNQTACSDDVRAIQNFHIDDRKWNDIGYNYLLGGDERIYEGRGWYAVGAHTVGMNDKAIAISLIGNFDIASPPEFMLNLTQKWIACAVEQKILTQDYQLHGHRDQSCTACPGQYLYEIIKTWNQFKGGKLDSYVCGDNSGVKTKISYHLNFFLVILAIIHGYENIKIYLVSTLL